MEKNKKLNVVLSRSVVAGGAGVAAGEADPFARRGSVGRSPTRGDMERSVSMTSVVSVASESGEGVKRKRMEEVETEGGECVAKIMEEMRRISGDIRRIMAKDESKVRKEVCEQIMNSVAEYEGVIVRVMCENERLRGKIEGLEGVKELAEGLKRSLETRTIERVEKEVEVVEKQPDRRQKSYAFMVSGTGEQSGEEVKKKMLREVSVQGVRVKAVRIARGGRVAVETADAKDMERLKGSQVFEKAGLKVEEAKKIGPKVIIFDVPSVMTEDSFKEELYEKNLKGKFTKEEAFQRLRVRSRSGKEKECGNVIVEMSRSMKECLVSEGRVYVGWLSLRVKEFSSVLRCYGCMGIGHMMRECKVGKVCRKCGESGHMEKDCKGKECCGNCKRRGVNAEHGVLSPSCPMFIEAELRMRRRVNDD